MSPGSACRSTAARCAACDPGAPRDRPRRDRPRRPRQRAPPPPAPRPAPPPPAAAVPAPARRRRGTDARHSPTPADRPPGTVDGPPGRIEVSPDPARPREPEFRRPDRAELAAAADRTIPDVIGPGCACSSAASTPGCTRRRRAPLRPARATASGRRCTRPASPRACCARASRANCSALRPGHHQRGGAGQRAGGRADPGGAGGGRRGRWRAQVARYRPRWLAVLG